MAGFWPDRRKPKADVPQERRPSASDDRRGRERAVHDAAPKNIWLISKKPLFLGSSIIKRPIPVGGHPNPGYAWRVTVNCGHDDGRVTLYCRTKGEADELESKLRWHPCWWTYCGHDPSAQLDPQRRLSDRRGAIWRRPGAMDRVEELGR